MTFFRQASATVRAAQGQAPSWIVPTLKGSTATVRPLQGLQFFVGSLTVGFTHGDRGFHPRLLMELPCGEHGKAKRLRVALVEPVADPNVSRSTCSSTCRKRYLRLS